jgi:hypothetical protein
LSAGRLAQGEDVFERLRRTLLDSFVGAIALGYLLAQCVLHFVNIFSAPVAGWISHNEYRALIPNAGATSGSSLRYALPDLARLVILLPVWYSSMRWLYYKPLETIAPISDEVK